MRPTVWNLNYFIKFETASFVHLYKLKLMDVGTKTWLMTLDTILEMNNSCVKFVKLNMMIDLTYLSIVKVTKRKIASLFAIMRIVHTKRKS